MAQTPAKLAITRLFRPPTILENKSAADVRCAILSTHHGETKCDAIVLHGNLAKSPPQEETRAVLSNTGIHCLTEVSTHDEAGDIGLYASPAFCCGFDLLGQALYCTQEILCQSTPGDPRPGDLASRDDEQHGFRGPSDQPPSPRQYSCQCYYPQSQALCVYRFDTQ